MQGRFYLGCHATLTIRTNKDTQVVNTHLFHQIEFPTKALSPIILDSSMHLSDEQIDAALQRWINFSLDVGVDAVFDAGIRGMPPFMSGSTPVFVSWTGRESFPFILTVAM